MIATTKTIATKAQLFLFDYTLCCKSKWGRQCKTETIAQRPLERTMATAIQTVSFCPALRPTIWTNRRTILYRRWSRIATRIDTSNEQIETTYIWPHDTMPTIFN